MAKKKLSTYDLAIGLAYDDSSTSAPLVNVKGNAILADEIVKLARKYKVPVVENQGLANALDQLEPEQYIPEQLYEAVALLMAELEE